MEQFDCLTDSAHAGSDVIHEDKDKQIQGRASSSNNGSV